MLLLSTSIALVTAWTPAAGTNSTGDVCKTCPLVLAESNNTSIDIAKNFTCNKSQSELHMKLASLTGHSDFATNTDPIKCFGGDANTCVIFKLPSSASAELVKTWEANQDGLSLVLKYVLWKQECVALDEKECRGVASHSQCKWATNGGSSGMGGCVISDRTCVENQSEKECLKDSACVWVHHDKVEDVSYVPCRPIKNWDQVCAVYITQERCAVNTHCRWSEEKCRFSSCESTRINITTEVFDPYSDETHDSNCQCSCARTDSDPRDGAEVCHFGQSCQLTDVSTGPYAVIQAKCVANNTAPPPNTCASYWAAKHCLASASDESKNWRPLWDKCSLKLPSSDPFRTCCRQTCAAWVEDGAKCSDVTTLISQKLCGTDVPCNQENCCLPTCAGFNCDDASTRPDGLGAGSKLKENPIKIPCKDDGSGKMECTFDMCCQITCKSKEKNICDELNNFFPRSNVADLLCSDNPYAVGADIATDGCSNKYCCQKLYTDCKDLHANYKGQCGTGDVKEWYYDAPALGSQSCGGKDAYKCDEPTYCCQRKCSNYTAQQGCYNGTVAWPSKQDTNCNKECSQEKCCTKTCGNFNCDTANTGLVAKYDANGVVCDKPEDCTAATCCMPTCQTHYLKKVPVGYTQSCSATGVSWREDLNILCGVTGSATDCMSETYCCRKTCAHYVATAGCGYGYVPNVAYTGTTCDSGKISCSKDLCCIPTCQHYIGADNKGCSTGELLNQGWQPVTPSSKQCDGQNYCGQQDCCQRSCAAWIESTKVNVTVVAGSGSEYDTYTTTTTQTTTTYTTTTTAAYTTTKTDAYGKPIPAPAPTTTGYTTSTTTTTTVYTYVRQIDQCIKNRLVINDKVSTTMCNGNCNIDLCCEGTCKTHDYCAGHGITILSGKEEARCSTNPDGYKCTKAFCCGVTCAALPSSDCQAGWVKDDDKNSRSCTPTGAATGTAADCSSSQCCKPTCASYQCTNGYVKKSLSASSIMCSHGGCTPELCCDTTCESFSHTGGQCIQYEAKRENANNIACKHGSDCQSKCCLATCGSWFIKTGKGDNSCGVNPVHAAGSSYPGGTKKNNHNDLLCSQNIKGDYGGECSLEYCCEYTCAKFYANFCSGGDYTLTVANADKACSANPDTSAVVSEGLEAYGKCTHSFCCTNPCTRISSCPEHEKITTSPPADTDCSYLTSCNVKKCCRCTADRSCIAEAGAVPTESCQLDYSGGTSCKPLEACKQASSEVVTAACLCGAALSDGSHVCQPNLEHCHKDQVPRCVPKCNSGGNAFLCQCKNKVCQKQNYCDTTSGTCTECSSFTAATCNTQYCRKEQNEYGVEECVAMTSSGSALVVGGTSALSGGAIAGIACGAVVLFAAGIFTASALPKKKQRQEPPSVDEYAQ